MKSRFPASLRIFPAATLIAILWLGAAADSHGAKSGLLSAVAKAAQGARNKADTVSPSPIADDSPIDPTKKVKKGKSANKKGGKGRASVKSRKAAKKSAKNSSDSGKTANDN